MRGRSAPHFSLMSSNSHEVTTIWPEFILKYWKHWHLNIKHDSRVPQYWHYHSTQHTRDSFQSKVATTNQNPQRSSNSRMPTIQLPAQTSNHMLWLGGHPLPWLKWPNSENQIFKSSAQQLCKDLVDQRVLAVLWAWSVSQQVSQSVSHRGISSGSATAAGISTGRPHFLTLGASVLTQFRVSMVLECHSHV